MADGTFEDQVKAANRKTVMSWANKPLTQRKSGKGPARGTMAGVKKQVGKRRAQGEATLKNMTISYNETGSKRRRSAMDNLGAFGSAVNSIDFSKPKK